MTKERLEELIDDITFAAKSYNGVESLINYAREQAERAQELEQQNKRYREALEKIAWKQSNIEDKRVIVKHQVIARKALEDDCIHCNGKGFNGLDYCPQCNQMEEDDDN